MAVNITVGLMSPIYSQIDPLRLGETERAIRIALEYGERLGKSNLKDGTLAKLVMKYPDHSFVIDRAEAEELFKNVRKPTELEFKLAAFLQPVVDKALYGTTIVENITKEIGGTHEQKEGGGEDPAGDGSQSCCDQQRDIKTPPTRDNENDGEIPPDEHAQTDGEVLLKN